MTEHFKPAIYLKQGCPFCFKLRVFLLEAGLLDGFKLKEFAPESQEENHFREELSPHFEKLSFPAAQIAPGKFAKDSDALISHFASKADVDPATLPTFQAYVEGPFNTLMALFKENTELKQGAA